MEEKDFIVSELLSELKEENKRKEAQIKTLHHAIVWIVLSALLVVFLVIGSCFLYLNQYDFSSTESYNIEKSAEGMFAVIDSDGNIIGYDEPVNDNGESIIQDTND